MTNGISPLELASAYGSFATQGVHVEPISYTKVTNRLGDTVLLDGTTPENQAMDPGTAYIVNDMLRTTVANGIAYRAGVSGVPVAGKTGTSSENYDAWFVGNTPTYSAAVWIGLDVQIEMSQGSAAAATLFSKIMTRVYENIEDPGSFPERPSNVISATVDGRSEIFIEGTVPDHLDYGSVKLEICVETGLIATPWCPVIEEHSFNRARDPEDPLLVEHPELNENLAPNGYCNVHNQDPEEYPPGTIETGPSGYTEGYHDTAWDQPSVARGVA